MTQTLSDTTTAANGEQSVVIAVRHLDCNINSTDNQTITRRVSIQIVPVATTTVVGGGGELQGDSGAMGLGVDNKLLISVLAVPLFGLLTGLMGMFI